MTVSRHGISLLLLALFGMLLAAGCGQENSTTEAKVLDAMTDLNEASLAQLAGTRIYFGHQSVGGNILDGMQQLAERNPGLQLHFLHLGGGGAIPAEGGWIADSYIGNNADPDAKNRDFSSMLATLPPVNVAFYKYCYLDIDPRTDVHALFRNYRETIERLQSEYPATTFVHVTAPLTVLQRGPKAWVKTLIGRDISGHADNMKRHEYNELLRQQYLGKEPLFDLARLESTRPDGTRMSFEAGGQTYYALVPGYTPDDGHLNAVGQAYIASELLGFLTHLVERQGQARN